MMCNADCTAESNCAKHCIKRKQEVVCGYADTLDLECSHYAGSYYDCEEIYKMELAGYVWNGESMVKRSRIKEGEDLYPEMVDDSHCHNYDSCKIIAKKYGDWYVKLSKTKWFKKLKPFQQE